MNFLLARSTYEVQILNTIKTCLPYHFDNKNKGPRSTPWGKVLYTSSSLRYGLNFQHVFDLKKRRTKVSVLGKHQLSQFYRFSREKMLWQYIYSNAIETCRSVQIEASPIALQRYMQIATFGNICGLKSPCYDVYGHKKQK